MAQTVSYREEFVKLEIERKPSDRNAHASRLNAQGDDERKERPVNPMLDLLHERPQKISAKVRIPVKEYPRYNFVGKLLGPKGQTLQALQDQTGCKMAIMGRGSMRDKEKEEELRKEGGKYAHLNEELHILVECYTDVVDGYYRLAGALAELRNFINPELSGDMYGAGPEGDIGINGGAPRGRGGYRAVSQDRVRGRGGFRGRGNGPVPPPVGRGVPPARGLRGAPRGGPSGRGGPSVRSAPPTRGARSAVVSSPYDGYGQGYGYDLGYDDGYGQNYASGPPAGYDAYSGSDYVYDAIYGAWRVGTRLKSL